MKRRPLASCGVLVAMLVVRAASAQSQYVPQGDSPQWLKDRRFNEGVGLRAGELEFHPGIAAEAGYDSNWLLRSNRDGVVNGPRPPPPFQRAPIVPALELRVTPSLYVSTLSPQRREGDTNSPAPNLMFRGGFNVTYREFICLGSNCSGPNDISQQRGLSGSADARLDILPEHPVGGAVFANYAHAAQPNMTTINPDLSFDNDTLGLGGEVAWQPGGGTYDAHLGAQARGTLFNKSAGVGFDNAGYSVYTRMRWKFRPRTAFLYDASLGFNSYVHPELATQQGLVNSTPIHMRIGLNGLITDRFAVLALVGWAASFFDNTIPTTPQYDSVIGQAEFRWFLAANPGASALGELGLALSSITLGYSRDYQPSYLGNFYGTDRGYLRFNYFFAGRAVVSLEGGVGAIEYPAMYWGNGDPRIRPAERTNAGFTDIRADATLFGEYRFSNTFGLNTTLRYTANFSSVHDMTDTQTPPGQPPPMPQSLFDMEWSRYEAFVGARFFW